MNVLDLDFFPTILIGLGATLVFDLSSQIIKHAFKIAPSNICLVGRWLRYMPEGIFKHSNIGSAPPKQCRVCSGMDSPLHDWHHVCDYFHRTHGQQLASTSNADSRNRLRGCHSNSTICHHAANVWIRICCIQDSKSCAGKTS